MLQTLVDPTRAAAAIAGDLAMMHEPGYGTAGMFRACYIDDMVMVADDVRLTDGERALLARGRSDLVRANRSAFQYVCGPIFVAIVEQATARRVASYSSNVHLEPLFEIAVFRLAPADETAAV